MLKSSQHFNEYYIRTYIEMKKYKECSKFATAAIKEFQTTLSNNEDIDSHDVSVLSEYRNYIR